MHTVFIKSVELGSEILINVDNIERISFSKNVILAFNMYEERYSIYEGKAVNDEKALSEVVNLIHSAKRYSETHNQAVIMDFLKDLDNPQIVLPLERDVSRFKRLYL